MKIGEEKGKIIVLSQLGKNDSEIAEFLKIDILFVQKILKEQK